MPAPIKIEQLRTCGLAAPLAVDTPPEFSWRTSATGPATRIESATVELRRGTDSAAPVWTGKQVPAGIPAVVYDGPPLQPRTRYLWRVGLDLGDTVVWSAHASFETGLGEDLPELADWIGVEVTEPTAEAARVQYLRRSFTVPETATRARVYATALGWYGLLVNGTDVTGNSITPRFTALDHRAEYHAYDVTAAITAGANTVELRLADGRFRGRNGAEGTRAVYGNQLAALALLEVECADGTTVTVATDDTWEACHGPLVTADPQEGVRIDARVDVHPARTATGDPCPVSVFSPQVGVVAAVGEPVRLVREIAAQRITAVDGHVVVDFGQNLVGVTRLVLSGERGHQVTVAHSEVVRPDGHVDMDYLDTGGAIPRIDAIDHYTLAGAAEEVFEPRFTLRGFRYIEVSGVPADHVHSATALVLAADLEHHGEFRSSHRGLERLHENIRWSMLGNFTDVATDCPTRERSGWTGDVQVFAPAGAMIADLRLFLEDWLRDVALQQDPDGAVPDVVPRDALPNPQYATLFPGRGSAGWGDAVVMVPWTLYQHYGRSQVLHEMWDAMVAWVEFCRRRAAENRHPDRTGPALAHERYLVDTGFHWGEWLEPGNEPSPEAMMESLTRLSTHPDAEVATGYFAHVAHLLSKIADVLGKEAEAEEYRALWRNVRDAYRTEFLDDDGLPRVTSQAKLVRPLTFELLPADARPAAARLLATRVRADGNRLSTGFLSTGYLLPCLSDWGYDDVAVDVLLQEESPSWLGQVGAGATTVLETWEGMRDGKPYGSQNHYALGAVARWMYEHLAGLHRTEPGWSAVQIRPVLTERIASVSASTTTPFGRLGSAWHRDGRTCTVHVQIPPGVRATLHLPTSTANVRIELPPGNSSWQIAGTGTVTRAGGPVTHSG